MSLFKPIRWRRFPRDFVVIQFGFAVFGMSIALFIQANLGTSPWVMLAVALADIFSSTPGTLTVLTGVLVLAISFALKEPVGWGTVGNILFIGPWVDLFLGVIPLAEDNWPLQIGLLLTGVLSMGLSTALYIGVNAGAGPRDSLMLAVSRTTGWSLGWTRGAIELCVFVISWLLGGPFGVGTIVIALLIGPAVQGSFKLLKVDTSH